MSVWRKCTTGPEFPTQCARCRRTIIVPAYSVVAAAAPGLGAIGLLGFSSPWAIVGGIAGIVTYITLQQLAFPLKRIGFDPRFDRKKAGAAIEPPPAAPRADAPSTPPH